MGIKIPDIKKTLKSKIFWISLVIVILSSLGTVYGHQIPELAYLQLPLFGLIVGIIPAISAQILSVKLALGLFWVHKNAINFSNKNNISYKIQEKYLESFSYRKFALYNLWYTSGLTFLLLRFSGIDLTNIGQLIVITMAGVFLFIVFASGLNFAIFLIQRKSIFFENKKDASYINLGSDLRRIINYGFGPIQIIFFIYSIIVESDILFFLIAIGMALLICGGSSITSYFILKKHYIDIIYEKFDRELKI